jgi:hypothetical protein
MYDLPNLLLFSVLAIMSGCDSYRKIHIFIKTHLKKMKKVFGAKWGKAPGYTTIRKIIQGMKGEELEKAFRKYSAMLVSLEQKENEVLRIGFDGKTLRGSFDNFHDEKAVQILSAFVANSEIIVAHKEIKGGEKTNEIPKVQELIQELGLTGCVFTGDAMHCQKKL